MDFLSRGHMLAAALGEVGSDFVLGRSTGEHAVTSRDRGKNMT
jgi:hypothetical protein